MPEWSKGSDLRSLGLTAARVRTPLHRNVWFERGNLSDILLPFLTLLDVAMESGISLLPQKRPVEGLRLLAYAQYRMDLLRNFHVW
jgi:hypothetical protein